MDAHYKYKSYDKYIERSENGQRVDMALDKFMYLYIIPGGREGVA